jgi:hypothetical protein
MWDIDLYVNCRDNSADNGGNLSFTAQRMKWLASKASNSTTRKKSRTLIITDLLIEGCSIIILNFSYRITNGGWSKRIYDGVNILSGSQHETGFKPNDFLRKDLVNRDPTNFFPSYQRNGKIIYVDTFGIQNGYEYIQWYPYVHTRTQRSCQYHIT